MVVLHEGAKDGNVRNGAKFYLFLPVCFFDELDSAVLGDYARYV